MTTAIARTNGKATNHPATASSAAAATATGEGSGGTAVLALGLLAHWWSRPSATERAFWAEAVEAEQELVIAITGVENPDTLLGAGLDGDAVAEEYEHLFVGPGHVPCPPYESYWREDVSVDIRRSLMGPCTAALRDLYAQLELEVAPAAGELPDHVAVELEALAYALSFDETVPVAQAIFDHLRHWLPRLCRAVAHEATVPFYGELARRSLVWLAYIQLYVASLAGDTSGST